MEIESDDLERMTGKLRGKLSRAAFKAVIDRIARKVAVVLESRAIIYPPKRPDSEYDRTGRLGMSLTSDIERHGTFTVVVVGTNVKYAVWVVGDVGASPGQVKVHRGIWTPLSESVAAQMPVALTIAEKEMAAAIKVFEI